jgi:hypothetical protein
MMAMWKDVVGGDWECVGASMREMRCKGTRVMWQRERMWWQRGVIGQGGNDNNSGGDMEWEWKTDVGR